jgi:Flp pilus assembly protein TadD
LGAVSLDLLGKALTDAGEFSTAESVLRRVQRRHAGDVWIKYDLAGALLGPNRRDKASRFYTAVRPETVHQLDHFEPVPQ